MTKVSWSDFVIWQCSLRQRNFRMFAGKPSDGTIANILDIKTEKESLFSMLKKYELTKDDHYELMHYANKKNIQKCVFG